MSVPSGVPSDRVSEDKVVNCGIDPATKSQIWDSITHKMKTVGRKDGKRRGLAVADLQPDEAEAAKAAGWQQETTQTGISILWATEKAVSAMRLES